jgi:hypothetical protein
MNGQDHKWLTSFRMAHYQGLLCENPWVRLQTVGTLNPATFLLTKEGLPDHDSKEVMDRPARSLLCWPVPFRPARLVMNRHLWSLPCVPLRLAQACTILHWAMHLKSAKLAIHRHTWSPFYRPVPFRHAKPTFQRPASSPQWKASTSRPIRPHALAPTTGGLQTLLEDTDRSRC